MFTNLWNQTTFVCGCHKNERVPFEYNDRGNTMFYSCPKYLNHTREEKACRNNLSFNAAEKLLDKLSDEMFKNEGLDLTGYEFSWRGIDAKVEELTESKAVISIVNHKSLA